MEIEVKRYPSLKGATIGELSIDGVFECYTLEDEVREPSRRDCDHGNATHSDIGVCGCGSSLAEWVKCWKIPNETAIPRGRYQVIVDFSQHFSKLLPRILAVPGYSGVRIHPGNSAADTEGCILVGKTKEANLIYQSRDAFNALFPKIQAALAVHRPVYLSIA